MFAKVKANIMQIKFNYTFLYIMTKKNHISTSITFIKKSKLILDSYDAEIILAKFLKEMKLGLSGKKSSLAMIPTFITVSKSISINKPVIVIDAGGTNLRICTVTFNSNGSYNTDSFSKHQMPGFNEYISKIDFFMQFVKLIKPLADKSDKIGFCFSYPAEIYPNLDGRLLYWTKEIQAPEVEGELIGKNIISILKQDHYEPSITILNDTVATLLAGKCAGTSKNYSSYVGFILGTGTNTAYTEYNSNIHKCSNLPQDKMQPINIESGSFNKCPRSKIDIAFDNSTMNPGKYIFEKMIAGAYRGGLCLELMKTACTDNLFSKTATKEILSWNNLETWHITHFLNDPTEEGPFNSSVFSEKDILTIKELCLAITERAALLVAINIAAAIIKGSDNKSKTVPCCVNVDGSTFHKLKGFKESVETKLHDLLDKRNIPFELVNIDNSPLIGAAVAGLSRDPHL